MKKFLGLFGLIAIAALAPSAHANFAISINGTTCASGAGSPTAVGGEVGACGSVSVTGGVVTLESTQGTQTTSNSEQLTSNLSITTTAATTITIDAAVNDFSSPTTPPNVTDSFTFTLNQTTGNTTGVFTACVDQGNGLTAPTGTCGAAQSLTVTGSQSSSSPTGVLTLSSLSALFGLNQQVVLTLAAGTSLNVTETQTLTQVPEPGSIVLLGGVLVGLSTLLRKKLARQA